jgi:hypothetical protein
MDVNIMLLEKKMWAFHWKQPPLSYIKIINNIIEEVAKIITRITFKIYVERWWE